MDRKKQIAERDYLTDRLTEISVELKRLSAEGNALKTELEAVSDVPRRRAIRRRRSYIARRNTDLRAEREKATAERNNLIEQLEIEMASIPADPL